MYINFYITNLESTYMLIILGNVVGMFVGFDLNILTVGARNSLYILGNERLCRRD